MNFVIAVVVSTAVFSMYIISSQFRKIVKNFASNLIDKCIDTFKYLKVKAVVNIINLLDAIVTSCVLAIPCYFAYSKLSVYTSHSMSLVDIFATLFLLRSAWLLFRIVTLFLQRVWVWFFQIRSMIGVILIKLVKIKF